VISVDLLRLSANRVFSVVVYLAADANAPDACCGLTRTKTLCGAPSLGS